MTHLDAESIGLPVLLPLNLEQHLILRLEALLVHRRHGRQVGADHHAIDDLHLLVLVHLGMRN